MKTNLWRRSLMYLLTLILVAGLTPVIAQAADKTDSADDSQIFSESTNLDKSNNTNISEEDTIQSVATSGDLNSFKDISKDAWYYEAVDWALEKGVMKGVSKDQFDPDGMTTRAMLVTMLWRLEESPAEEANASFTDVPEGTWYTDSVNWAANNGIVNGYSAKTFGAMDNVTREQLATILYRYAQKKGQGFVGSWAFQLSFTDADQISDYAYEALCWMTMNDIIKGRDDGTVAPKDGAARAEVAAILSRYYQLVEGQEQPVVGGWEPVTEGEVQMPEAVKSAFEKATVKLTGIELTPIAYYAAQVVEGMNYRVLCRSTLITEEPANGLHVVSIHADLHENAEILELKPMDLAVCAESVSTDLPKENLPGGWNVPEDYTTLALPEDVQNAFDQAVSKLAGNELKPLALLGTQVVEGNNYAVLCHSKLATAESAESIQVAILHTGLDTEASIINLCTLDLASEEALPVSPADTDN